MKSNRIVLSIFLLIIGINLTQQTHAISDNAAAIGLGVTSGIVSGAFYCAGVPSYIAPLIPYAGLVTFCKRSKKKINKPGIMVTTASITGSLIGGLRALEDSVKLVGPEADDFFRKAPDALAGVAIIGGGAAMIAAVPFFYLVNVGTYAVGSLIPSIATYCGWDFLTT